MRVYYHLSDYISHRRAGLAYMACLRRLGHELTEDPARCDVAVIHETPHYYPRILQTLPLRPGTRRAGYAVWETPQLPEAFLPGLAQVDAVWTCSEFSRQAFAPHVPAFVLPHVVERPQVSPAALRRMAGRLGVPPDGSGPRRDFLFYSIIDSVNPRKNLLALLSAFATAFPGPGGNVRLVLKQYREPQDLSGIPHVCSIPETLDDEEIGALHALCDAYVSAHHAEAWGLPLSEAMSFGNPVIATGYSGNMEFMNESNSFPVPYAIAPVTEAMCRALPRLFNRAMTWADVDIPGLVRMLRRVRRLAWTAADRARVTADMARFAPEAVALRLQALLDALPTRRHP